MRGPSPDELLLETARLAYYFHWPLDTILDLEHPDRRRFLAEAAALADETADADPAIATGPSAPDAAGG
jgi:hypothetical protein